MPTADVLPHAGTVPDVDENVETGDGPVAHIVRVGPGENAAAKVLAARIEGTPVEALCGYVWVPSRDPRQLPPCQRCVDIYELYRALNDGLDDRPGE